MKPIFAILLIASGTSLLRADEDAAWTKPRDISAFQFLLDRSPFSLPTAEESSPLAERFSLTGAVAMDGEALVFVMDRNTQQRVMISKKPNAENMSLVEYLPDPDPRRMRATIRVGSEIATISFVEPSQPAGQPPAPAHAIPLPAGVPGNPQIGAAPNNPPSLTPGGSDPQQPPRRTIRRRIISGNTGP